MIESLLMKNDSVVDESTIPPPPDLSKVNPNVTLVGYISGTKESEYLGNQFQFNYNGTRMFAPDYNRAITPLYSVDVNARTPLTLLQTLPISSGVTASDSFHTLYTFRSNGSFNDGNPPGTRYNRQADGSYVRAATAPIELSIIDNYHCSSKGNLIYGKYAVFRYNADSDTYTKVIDYGTVVLQGAIFSEDERVIVAIGRTSRFMDRWEYNDDTGEFVMVRRSTFSQDHEFPATDPESGMEVGFNHDLSRFALPLKNGVNIFRLDVSSGSYNAFQVLPYPSVVTPTRYVSVSMDRSGTFIAFTRRPSAPVLYRMNRDGTYSLLHTFNRPGTDGSHKVKLSPDGRILGHDTVTTPAGQVSESRGIYLFKIYDL